MKLHLSIALAPFACALLPLAALAQVRVELVAADISAQPGAEVTLAVRMEHEPGWHTYWINAGIGAPTQIRWTLPHGWTADGIAWPVPRAIRNSSGEVTGQGYSDLLLLPVKLSVPASAAVATDVDVKAHVAWVMCEDICIPGKKDLSLKLPISAIAKPNSEIRAQIAKMPMPASPEGWQISADSDGGTVTLRIAAPDAVEEPRFFSEDPFVRYDQPQALSGDSRTFTLSLSRDRNAKMPALLNGILAFSDDQGRYRGVHVAAALPQAAHLGQTTGETPAPASMPFVLLLAFMGGLILNLMPCVFPVLGIKVLGFVEQASGDRRHVVMHGLAFTAGVVMSFWLLVAILAFLRAGGETLGWGFQLQSAAFVYVLAIVLLIFALNLSGVFEFGLSATGIGSGLASKSSHMSSALAGVLATVVATPCSAPFLAPALGAALTLPIVQSLVVFTCVALGLSAPYLLLSAYPRAIRLLPRPGRWMATFKQFMAFPLYATLAYLVWVLAGQTSEDGLLVALLGLTLVALATWLHGRYQTLDPAPGKARIASIAAVLILASGTYLGWPKALQEDTIVWEPWSEARVDELRSQNRYIYVDFTARWCATCQTNKKLVFGSAEVLTRMRELNIALLKADWTNADPAITNALASWNRSAVPFNLVYLPDEAQPRILPELLTPSMVLDALARHTPQQ